MENDPNPTSTVPEPDNTTSPAPITPGEESAALGAAPVETPAPNA